MTDARLGVWEELENAAPGPGVVYRRLHPKSARDLRAVLDPATGRRTVLFERSWKPSDQLPKLVQSRAVSVDARRSADGTRLVLALSLTDRAFQEVFSVLVDDVAAAAAAAANDHDATVVLLARLEAWRELLDEQAAAGLSTQFRRGLFGELHALTRLLLPRMQARAAVSSWTGPFRANQDFQYEHCALEVKATAGQQPQTLVISNERELDDKGVGRLYLLHVSLDERQGGEGMSLNAAVDRALDELHDLVGQRELRDRLVRYGYLESQRELYDEPRYSVRGSGLYRVTGAFPRITEADLPEGVGAVRYTLTLSAIKDHAVAVEELYTDLGGTRNRSGQ